MTKTTGSAANTARKRITLERTYRAPLEDVWALWTTKEGLESWWGPDGFRVEVHVIDLRPGGELRYDMIASAPEMIEFMRKAGMLVAQPSHATFTEVTPMTRLAYLHSTDFIPGIEPYEVATLVELFPKGDSVRMVLSFDAMHDEVWTGRAVQGWEMELGKLEAALAERARKST
jgi:uncharacterized protein YndB with AHSA1/START domain